MKRLFTISLVALSLIFASTVQADGFFYKLRFVGFWQGVDFSDGSEAERSITLNADGTFYIIGQEPYTSGCGKQRGMVTGTGVLEDGVIISKDFTLTCFDEDDPYSLNPVTATYRLNMLNGTLIEAYPGLNFEPMILHKISKR